MCKNIFKKSPAKLEALAFTWWLASLDTCRLHHYMPCSEANSNILLLHNSLQSLVVPCVLLWGFAGPLWPPCGSFRCIPGLLWSFPGPLWFLGLAVPCGYYSEFSDPPWPESQLLTCLCVIWFNPWFLNILRNSFESDICNKLLYPS